MSKLDVNWREIILIHRGSNDIRVITVCGLNYQCYHYGYQYLHANFLNLSAHLFNHISNLYIKYLWLDRLAIRQ